MIDKPDSPHTLGLELEGPILKMVQLTLIKGKPHLNRLFEIVVDPDNQLKSSVIITEDSNKKKEESDVNPLYIAAKETPLTDLNLRELINQHLVTTCLNGSQTIVRNFEIKLKKERDILAALPFQVEPILPFAFESAVIDKITIAKTVDGTELTIFAAKKDHIKKHIEQWKSIRIEPEVVSSESVALLSFSNHFFSSKSAYFIVYFAKNHITCSLIKNKKLIASQSTFINESHANDVEPLANDTVRLLYALSKQMKGQDVLDVLYLGDLTHHEDLLKTLHAKLNKQRAELNLDPNFAIGEFELQKFAVPLGLALSTLSRNEDLINFRQQELTYPDPWKHLKKPLAFYMLIGLCLAISFHFFGKAYLNTYEDEIKNEYVSLLSGMNKPYSAFEAEYLTKFPHEAKEFDEIVNVQLLTSDELNNRLSFLYNELQASPDMFPLFPNIPRVSDVLAWLSNHPNVVERDAENNITSALIQLESFTYTMVKKPENAKKQEKYQVKVEFEFNTATPKLAREFHDALIAPNNLLDPKGEVKWSSNRGKYKTSFYLKDKTVYPTNRF
jgi:type IV pilus assembly protein PilM